MTIDQIPIESLIPTMEHKGHNIHQKQYDYTLIDDDDIKPAIKKKLNQEKIKYSSIVY